MNAAHYIRAILDATANQILAVVAPDTARLVRAYVSLDEEADTAATDGVRIWLPPAFEGVDVAHDTPVAVGLLVHELGHFLQPLKALEEAEQQTAAPHWLGNIVADVQLEAMMAGLFPPLADTLVAVRRTVSKNLWPRRGDDIGFLEQTAFYLQTRDCFKDKFLHVWFRLAIPTAEDWRWVPLPDSFFWLYYGLRPLRLGLEGLVLSLR